MSKIIKTHGIVLASYDYSDTDKILTVLTSNLGKISVIAKGARKKTKIAPLTEVFVLSSMILFKGSSMYHLNEGTVIDQLYNLRLDYDKMLAANEIIKFVNNYTIDNSIKNEVNNQSSFDQISEYNKIFKLTIIALFNIQERDRYELIKSTYIIRFLKYIGNQINFKKIDESINENTTTIYIESENIYISKDIYEIIKYIITCKIEKVFNFKTNLEKESKLIEFQKIYLENHI